MNPNFRFSSLAIVIVVLSIIAISAIGFMNNSYAANTSMNNSMSMNSSVTMNASKAINENMGMHGNMSTPNNQTSISPSPPPTKILSPLAQVTSGIAPNHVKCGQGYGLILNLFDSRPACIKSEDMTNFISRGWGHAVT